ncbi:MAG: hypothetical protein ACRCZJ_09695 [Erysipelotrichaceae bacterium]
MKLFLFVRSIALFVLSLFALLVNLIGITADEQTARLQMAMVDTQLHDVEREVLLYVKQKFAAYEEEDETIEVAGVRVVLNYDDLHCQARFVVSNHWYVLHMDYHHTWEAIERFWYE